MADLLHVLIIEDNDDDVAFIIRELRKGGFEPSWDCVRSESDLKAALHGRPWDAVISDYHLPQFSAPAALAVVKQSGLDLPFIVVSGMIGETLAVEMMKAGASDYLMKGNLQRLSEALRREIREARIREERRQTERALLIKDAAVESSISAIGLADLKGTIIYVNPSYLTLWKYEKKEDVIGTSLMHYAGVDKIPHRVMSEVFSVGSYQFDSDAVRNDGSPLHVQVSANLVRDHLGQPICVMASFLDITERIRAEQEILAAKERAEEASRRKTYFLANMSHELRTPLNSIMGFADILQSEIKDPDLAECAKNILHSSNRLLETVTLALDMSSVESNKLKVVPSRVDAAETIAEMIGLFSPAAERKNLVLRAELPSTPIEVVVDERLFRSTLSHLFSNAIKFTRRGEVVVKASTHFEKGRSWGKFTITDTGIGIAPEDIERIFEEFRQASEGTSRRFEGTGLGLTLARRFTELMQGSITVQSKVDEGTSFTLLFPLADESQPRAELPKAEVQPVPVRMAKPSGSWSILSVDDDEMSSTLIGLFLKELGSVDLVTNKENALRAIKEKSYDLILMDINLGQGVNGVDVAMEIRREPGYDTVPIIAVTAFALASDRKGFLEAGMSEYISKPYTRESLRRTVEQLLTRTAAKA